MAVIFVHEAQAQMNVQGGNIHASRVNKRWERHDGNLSLLHSLLLHDQFGRAVTQMPFHCVCVLQDLVLFAHITWRSEYLDICAALVDYYLNKGKKTRWLLPSDF